MTPETISAPLFVTRCFFSFSKKIMIVWKYEYNIHFTHTSHSIITSNIKSVTRKKIGKPAPSLKEFEIMVSSKGPPFLLALGGLVRKIHIQFTLIWSRRLYWSVAKRGVVKTLCYLPHITILSKQTFQKYFHVSLNLRFCKNACTEVYRQNLWKAQVNPRAMR